MIPFIKATEIDKDLFISRLNQCDGTYSNHGKWEQALVRNLETLLGFPVATACNATIALQILQAMDEWPFSNYQPSYRPAFTFPATNLVQDADCGFHFLQPQLEGPKLGFSEQVKYSNGYQILTIPFGCFLSGLSEKCMIPTIVDAAACASPDMHIVKEWLGNGAQAVVVSLHATKIWNAGEGAFVAFKHYSVRDLFLRKQNFGIEVEEENRICNSFTATNGKMSELSAIGALSSWFNFCEEWKRRQETVENLIYLSRKHKIKYIPSMQSFFIAPENPGKKRFPSLLNMKSSHETIIGTPQ